MLLNYRHGQVDSRKPIASHPYHTRYSSSMSWCFPEQA